MASLLHKQDTRFLLFNTQLLVLIFSSAILSSQNLIKNSSFEQYAECPKALGNFNHDVTHWSTPTNGSTDYFNSCSLSMGTPQNFNGEQRADFGQGYAGLYLYAPDDYREYLQAELKKPLEKNIDYQVSFFVSLAERSDFAIKEFGVLFANNKLNVQTKKELSKSHWYKQKQNIYSYVEIGYTNFYANTQDWVLISTRFVAKGGERFLILGNFKNNARTRTFKTKHTAKQGAYYYIDAVEVKAAEIDQKKSFTRNAYSTQENVISVDRLTSFKRVLFEFDKYAQLKSGTQEIAQLAAYLHNNPSLKITIIGHTDSVGHTAYNNKLSLLRAKTIANHLTQSGIQVNRIQCQGFGGSQPVTSNLTERERQLNRRVEFIISN